MGDGGRLLPYRAVDAYHAGVLLVHDRLEGDRGFTGLPVADDKLTLTATDRYHAVDGDNACFKRSIDAVAVDKRRGGTLRGIKHIRLIGGGIERSAHGVEHAPDHFIGNGHFDHAVNSADAVTNADRVGIVEKYRADAVFLKVHDHAVNAAVKLQKLAVAAAAEPVDPDDSVADLGHGAVIVYDFLLLKVIYSFAQICAYFGRRIAFHASSSPSICSVSRRS